MLLGYWAAWLLACWSTELLACWAAGLLENCAAGLLGSWAAGPLVYQNHLIEATIRERSYRNHYAAILLYSVTV